MFKLILLSLFSIANALAFPEVSFDLSGLDEDEYLGPQKEARLLALVSDDHPFDLAKEPLILVHGIRGQPSDLQNIVTKFKDSSYQLYVLAYSDFRVRAAINGSFFASELKKLPGQNYAIVAHSMGGIVARKALADLVSEGSIQQDASIDFYTIDTPWHGFDGPGDHEMHGFRMGIARLFLPDGLEDMRAKSDFFIDLNSVSFPENIRTHIAFAEEGTEALDYTEGFSDEYQQSNFYEALELTGNLSHARREGFENYFPRFPGAHTSVLQSHPDDYSYLNYLEDQLL